MNLLENYSIPIADERRESFVTNSKVQRCVVMLGQSNEEICEFVKNTSACHLDEQFFSYIDDLFCVQANYEFYLRFTGMILFCFYLFFILAITADKFFCPALTYLSNKLGLSENLAGATILAAGNGSPDIFTALAGYGGDTEMFYSQMFGGGLFVIGIIAAMIIIIAPFTISKRALTRDITIYMIACVWISRAFRNENFSYFEANGTLVIYFIYLSVLIGEHILSKSKQKGKDNNENENLSETATEQFDSETTSEQLNSPNKDLIKQFSKSINILDFSKVKKGNLFQIIVYILKFPILLVLTFMIPIVDSTLKINGWSKLLNSIQIVLMPIAVILIKQRYSMKIFKIPILLISILISTPVAIITFMTSRTDRAPKFQLLIAIFGSFVGSIVIISTCASEVISILSTFGNVSNISDSLLGLSLLSWGNSVGDLVLNVSLAKKGLPQMGFSACFGGPIFNSLITTGIRFHLKLYFSENGLAQAREGATGPNCYIFLFSLLLITLISFAFTNFQGRQSIGILMVITYTTFLLFCVLSEFQILHPYGTDHQYNKKISKNELILVL